MNFSLINISGKISLAWGKRYMTVNKGVGSSQNGIFEETLHD